MPSFEETWDDKKKTKWAVDKDCAWFWYDAGASAATLAAANRAGDAANEAEKAQRLEDAVNEITGEWIEGPYQAEEKGKLRAIIAKAQG